MNKTRLLNSYVWGEIEIERGRWEFPGVMKSKTGLLSLLLTSSVLVGYSPRIKLSRRLRYYRSTESMSIYTIDTHLAEWLQAKWLLVKVMKAVYMWTISQRC